MVVKVKLQEIKIEGKWIPVSLFLLSFPSNTILKLISYRNIKNKISNELSEEKVLSSKLYKVMAEMNLDSQKKSITATEIIKITKKIGYELTQFQITEALYVSKGGYKTNGLGEFSVETFI